MGINFHETQMGQKFFSYQLPSLIKAINRLADRQECKVIGIGVSQITDQKTKTKLETVMNDSEKAEAFADALCHEMLTDDERRDKMGHCMAKAIVENNVEDLLIAICGWSSTSLLNIAETGSPYPVNNKEGQDREDV